MAALPIQETENSCIEGDGKVGERSEHPIEQWEKLAQNFTSFLPASPHSGYNLRPTAQEGYQVRKNFRLILEIAVHQHNGVATRGLQARGDRAHVSPVPRQVY